MAPPTLPTSLSPHVCILASPDVQQVLEGAGLPPLPEILQCFSPLPQITTRTTSLTSVPHASFALRFSDVVEIEDAVHEDEEHRAGRMMDWMGSRISERCQRWVDMLETQAADGGKMWRDRTPWWEEVKRCVEGDHIPSSSEGWNHPVSLILAVTTTAANPLQALQDLTTRAFDFPPWVDLTSMRYFLIIHPSNAPLADPIAEALFNAVKKQYGLHSFLLPLHLPTDPLPAPVPVPALPPRLPVNPSLHSPPRTPQPSRPGTNTISPAPTPPPHPASPMPSSSRPPPLTLTNKPTDVPPPSPTVYTGSTLRLTQDDIQQIGRFVREFVTMSLIPWMEKCVVEWNENYSSSRRLPSRLFSSTRRLFGASSAASSPATPTHGSSPSVSSVTSRFTHGPNSSVSSIASVTSISTMGGGSVNQQRRLAEFATILGDYKLAISVWETLRKEGRGGSDVLPLLSAPSPALSLHADHALSTLRGPQPRQGTPFEVPAHAQYRALAYAVRWEAGIDRQDFLSSTLEGERWLVKAASSAEEPPTAILYAHAAFLSEIKGARRKAAYWYLVAAEKLEKTGIKPLAMYFFRKAHNLYRDPPPKELSPSFWESEDRSPTQWEGFSAVLPAIEHELGRLLYTTGDTASAVQFFLGLLRPAVHHGLQLHPTQAGNGAISPLLPQPSRDKVYLEDFRVAFKHFKTTEGDAWKKLNLQLPITFCQPKQTRIRSPGDAIEGDSAVWETLEEDWSAFWSTRGKEKLGKSGKAAVNETFWVDVALRNPLDVEVILSRLTVSVREASAKDAESNPDFVEVEVIDDIVLGPKDTRTIPVAVKCTQPATLVVTHTVFEFFSLLPATESLAVRGRRLNDTPLQRQGKVYAPDVLIKIEVEEAGQRLHAHFVDDRHLTLAQGEYKHQRVWLTNSGTRPIKELWVLAGEDDELCFDASSGDSTEASSSSPPKTEVVQSSNSLAPRQPYPISLEAIHSAPELSPGEEVQLPFILHAAHHGEKDLCLLFVFREAEGTAFHSARVTRRYEVKPIMQVSTSARPSASGEQMYIVNVEVENVTGSSNIEVKQVSTMSASWECTPMLVPSPVLVPPHQIANFSLGARPWSSGKGASETREFVNRKLKAVLQEDPVDPSEPPALDLTCTHVAPDTNIVPLHTPATRHFIHCGRRTMTAQATAASHPDIPARLHRSIFPLYNPSTVDIVLFWELPAQKRAGHILLQGPTLGAGHAALREIVRGAQNMKVKRSMYAETVRERAAILEAVQACEWNREDDPVAVFVHDGTVVEHDFRQGPCHVPVAFTFRNLSLTHPARVTLKLAESPESDPSDPLLPPPYAGRLTHRKVLKPTETYTAHAKLWASRPGCYALESWTAEIEVGEPSDAEDSAVVPWRSRQLRYLQRPRAGERPCVTVVDVGRLA